MGFIRTYSEEILCNASELVAWNYANNFEDSTAGRLLAENSSLKGAESEKELSGNGCVEFTAQNLDSGLCWHFGFANTGIGTDLQVESTSAVIFAGFSQVGSNIYATQGGRYDSTVASSTIATGDTFKIEISNDKIIYYKNETSLHEETLNNLQNEMPLVLKIYGYNNHPVSGNFQKNIDLQDIKIGGDWQNRTI